MEETMSNETSGNNSFSQYEKEAVLEKVSIDLCLPIQFSEKKQTDIWHASWQSDYFFTFTRISLVHFTKIDHIFGFLYPSLNYVIAFFMCMRVAWFCLVLNMFFHADIISRNIVDHLIWMLLLVARTLTEHSKEAYYDPFFAAQRIIFSHLNCPAIIKMYGLQAGI